MTLILFFGILANEFIVKPKLNQYKNIMIIDGYVKLRHLNFGFTSKIASLGRLRTFKTQLNTLLQLLEKRTDSPYTFLDCTN